MSRITQLIGTDAARRPRASLAALAPLLGRDPSSHVPQNGAAHGVPSAIDVVMPSPQPPRSPLPAGVEPPPALVFSERNAVARKWHAIQYEFEDVGIESGIGEIVAPALRPLTPLSRATYRINRVAGRRPMLVEVGLEDVRITRDYELLFAFFAFPTDIPHLQHLKGWREHCKKAVAFIGEIYSHDIEPVMPNLELLRELDFDRVYVFNARTAATIESIVRCPVEFLPLATDGFRFSPYPKVPPRVIDLYQFGRRSDATHAAALELALADELYYVYDTIFNVPLEDPRAHRQLVAHTMKRAKYFFAYRPGEDRARAAADDGLSARYFEAIGGGAVLLGSRPGAKEFDACFPWEDCVIEIPFEATNLREILAELEADPVRIALARKHNIVESLRRHDWGHRWARILDDVGVARPAALDARLAAIAELADLAEAGETAALEHIT
jgi:hypothetical protein